MRNGQNNTSQNDRGLIGLFIPKSPVYTDLLPSDLTGIYYFNQKEQEFEYRPGPLMAQILLADEINRATPRPIGSAGSHART